MLVTFAGNLPNVNLKLKKNKSKAISSLALWWTTENTDSREGQTTSGSSTKPSVINRGFYK